MGSLLLPPFPQLLEEAGDEGAGDQEACGTGAGDLEAGGGTRRTHKDACREAGVATRRTHEDACREAGRAE
ncbi:hypothetical protein CRENBAI_003944 [Crenichthys baileyi]|uniref:Uncharacterized protein n=1 Tax=Crenichthys baileyi TaxID=28760 RepID=A0AAV9S8K9_9TELE